MLMRLPWMFTAIHSRIIIRRLQIKEKHHLFLRSFFKNFSINKLSI